MNRQPLFQYVKAFLLIGFYTALFFYTLTFPSSFSWIIFYFFTFLFVSSYAATLFSWDDTQVELHPQANGTKHMRVRLRTKNRLPLLLPRLSFTLSSVPVTMTTEQDVLGKRSVQLSFPAASLPRGRYTSFELTTIGHDLLRLFPYVSRKRVMADFEVFPSLLSPSLRERAVRKASTVLPASSRFESTDTHFRQLRARQEQDSLKDVDWKTSFRTRELMVKEYEKEAVRPVTLCVFASPSPHFEALISLAYGLHRELSANHPVRLFLLGTFDQTVRIEQSKRSFTAIHPAEDTAKLFELWQHLLKTPGRKIVVAPEKDAWALQQSAPVDFLLLTEKDAIEQEAGL